MKKLLFLLQLLSMSAFGQLHNDSIQQVVLEIDIADSTYVFGEWNDSGGTETHLRYLGEITSQNATYKIMTSSWFWGLSRRATNKILVFDNHNAYVGNYYVTSVPDLPNRIEDNQIVFENFDDDKCENNAVTRISFENGIPEEFFLKCLETRGSFYSFSYAFEE